MTPREAPAGNDLPNLFPALNAATELALRESIRRFGVLVPVVRDQHGRTLDGHHRSRLAGEEKVPYRVDVVKVDSDDQAQEIAATLNADRRQLEPEQRREIVGALAAERSEDGVRTHSPNAIADALGVDRRTVLADEAELVSAHKLEIADKVLGKDGKVRPARRPTLVAAKNAAEAERAQQAMDADLPDGRVLDVKRAERIKREQDAERQRAGPVEAVTTDGETWIYHCDFRNIRDELNIEGAIVITDPPYPREFLPEWADMAAVTREAGCAALVAMSGQSLLPQCLDAIRRTGWVYRWCGAYITAGPATRVWSGNVGSNWKPILIFDNNGSRDFATTDVFRSTGDDKDHHHWGQNENGIAALVEAFTKPGDLVFDPFLGGGTTAVVCKALGRSFVGCDIDGAAVEATRARLAA